MATGRADGSNKRLAQVGGLLLVLAVAVGSRYWNRHSTSEEVKAVMISELEKDLGKEIATAMVDKVHWGCFEPNYQMSWRRRGTATFAGEKYASCTMRAIEHEAFAIRDGRAKARLQENQAEREALRLAREAKSAAADATSAANQSVNGSPAAVTPSAPPSSLAISGLTIGSINRTDRMVSAEFFAIGDARQTFMCRYSLACGADQRVVGDGIVACLKQRDPLRTDGSLLIRFAREIPAGACSLTVDLTDGTQAARSDQATVSLPQ